MFRLAIGEPYDPSVTEWPEGSIYNYDSSGHWILIMYRELTEEEIKGVQEGPIHFGLFVHAPVLFLLHQCGRMGWHDCPYSWWRVPPEDRSLPDVTPGYHALVKIVLIDSSTGLVRALRACTFSSEFTLRLHTAITGQSHIRWSDEEHQAIIQSVYRAYSPGKLAQHAGIRCQGGD